MCLICAKTVGTQQVTKKIKPHWLQLSSWRSKDKSLVTENGGAAFNLPDFFLNQWYLGWGHVRGKRKSFFRSTVQHSIFSLSLFSWVLPSLKVPFNKQQPITAGLFPLGCPSSTDSCWWPSLSQKNRIKDVRKQLNFSLVWFCPLSNKATGWVRFQMTSLGGSVRA